MIGASKKQVQFSHSVMSNSLQPHGLQHTRLPVLHQFLELAQIHVHRVVDAIQPSHPLLSPFPAFNFSQHQGQFFTSGGQSIGASASASVLPSNEYSGLISFRIDWFDLFAVQGTLRHWRRKWQPTPLFLPGESQGRGSLVGCCLWGHTESDTTEAT